MKVTWPIPPEFCEMIRQDMTVAEAIHYHRFVTWQHPRRPHETLLTRTEGTLHEFCHLIAGMCGLPLYQGNINAELFVIALQRLSGDYAFQGASANPSARDFYSSLQTQHAEWKGVTGLNRTLFWLVSRHTGESREDILERIGYDDTNQIQKEVKAKKKTYGITFHESSSTHYGPKAEQWDVSYKNEHYSHHTPPPADAVAPLQMPGYGEAATFFQRAKPFLALVGDKDQDTLAATKLSALVPRPILDALYSCAQRLSQDNNRPQRAIKRT